MMRDLRVINDKEIGFVDPYVVFKDLKDPICLMENSNGEKFTEVLDQPKGQKIYTLSL